MVNYLCDLDINLYIDNLVVFKYACVNNHKNLVKKIYNKCDLSSFLDIVDIKMLCSICCLFGCYDVLLLINSDLGLQENLIEKEFLESSVHFIVCCEAVKNRIEFTFSVEDLIMSDEDIKENKIKEFFDLHNKSYDMNNYLKLVKWMKKLSSRYVVELDEDENLISYSVDNIDAYTAA